MLHDKNKYSKPGVLTQLHLKPVINLWLTHILFGLFFQDYEVAIDLSLKTKPL